MKLNKQLSDSYMNRILKSLGGFSFFNNPSIIFKTSDGTPYQDENGNYVLSNSTTGSNLLKDSQTYVSNTIEGNFYRIEGADSVSPFSGGKSDTDEEYKKLIVDSMTFSKYNLTYESTWEEVLSAISDGFGSKYYEQTGSYTFWWAGGYSDTRSIVFPTPYLQKPEVTAWSTYWSYATITISNITTTGCTIKMYNKDPAGEDGKNVTLTWTAKGYVMGKDIIE